MTCAYAFGVGVDQTAFNMHDGDQWQCPGDCPQKASTNHWYYSTQKSEDDEVFVRFFFSSYSAIAISLDLRVS